MWFSGLCCVIFNIVKEHVASIFRVVVFHPHRSFWCRIWGVCGGVILRFDPEYEDSMFLWYIDVRPRDCMVQEPRRPQCRITHSLVPHLFTFVLTDCGCSWQVKLAHFPKYCSARCWILNHVVFSTLLVADTVFIVTSCFNWQGMSQTYCTYVNMFMYIHMYIHHVLI